MGSDEQDVWGRWASSADRSDRSGDEPRIDNVVTDYTNLPRDQTRVPLAHRIQLKFDRFSGFINEYFSNISPGGIFIRTETPEAPGQLLEFEFRLGDGYELIHGRGEVVWARARAEGPERPPGMGVRFIDLSPGSKDLIYKIVDDYVAHGGKPFDLAPPQPVEGDLPLTLPPLPSLPSLPASAAPAAQQRAPAMQGVTEDHAIEGLQRLAGPPDEVGQSLPRLAAAAAPGSPAAAASGAPSLPWTLDLPAIQPLPGVPAITPLSPLEALGLGAGGATGPGGAGYAALAGSAADDPMLAASGAAPGHGDAAGAGHPIDPFAQMAAALPPLDELAPEVPALPPAAPAALAPASPPAFSAFDLRAPHRPSRLPLVVALLAVAILGLTVFLVRDTLLDWIEKRDSSSPEQAAAGQPEPAASAPSAPRRLRGGNGPNLPVGSAGTAGRAGQAGSVGSAGTAGTVGQVGSAGSVGTAGAVGSAGPAALAPTPSAGAPAPAGTAPGRAVTTLAAQPAGAPGVAAGASSPPGAGSAAGGQAGRTVLEPLVTAGNGAGAVAPGKPLTAVLRITWERTADGTEVVLWGNGEFTSRSFVHSRIGGLPVREVLRISGIDRPFPTSRLSVRTPELVQIRTGYHPPQELHVVLDLGGRDVQVAGIEPGPGQLHIRLRAPQ